MSIGLRYLPPTARRLHHFRDLGGPFDFITWFDYAPEHECDFDALLAELRASEEWTSVEREIDIRSSTGDHVSGHGHWPDRRITRPARPCHTPSCVRGSATRRHREYFTPSS
jgi:hypothetical protein